MNLTKEMEDICRAQMFIGRKGREIHRHLENLKHKVSYQSVLTFVKKENERKSGTARVYKSYVFGEDSEKVQQIVKDKYKEDKRASERQIRPRIKRDEDIDISRSVLQSMKRASSLKTYAPLSVPKIKPDQAARRLSMVERWIANGERFDYWIFSDECSLSLCGNTHQVTTDDVADPARLLPTQAFPEKSVAVWGAISRLGRGPLVFLKKMEKLKDISRTYLEILQEHLLPYIDSTFGRQDAIYMQDGARCHTSRHALDTLRNQWGINVAEWAPCSPDSSLFGGS